MGMEMIQASRSLFGSDEKHYSRKKHESPTESPTERKKEVFTNIPIDVGLHIREVSPTVYKHRSPTESPTKGQADLVNLPIHVPLGVTRKQESPTHSPEKYYKKEGKSYRSLLGSPTESPTERKKEPERKKEVFTQLPVDVGLHIREVSPTVYEHRRIVPPQRAPLVAKPIWSTCPSMSRWV